MRRSPLLFVLPLLLVACTSTPAPGEGSSSSSVSSDVSSETSNRYEDPGIGYSITVPAGWTTVQDKDQVTESYQTKGTAFVAPSESGTTLDEAYFGVAQVESCPVISGPNTTSGSVMIAGTTFQKNMWSGAGAGNLYEGVTYAGPKDGGCLVLTGYLHSCNLGSDCGANHSTAFNKAGYLSQFDAMAQSVMFTAHPTN